MSTTLTELDGLRVALDADNDLIDLDVHESTASLDRGETATLVAGLVLGLAFVDGAVPRYGMPASSLFVEVKTDGTVFVAERTTLDNYAQPQADET